MAELLTSREILVALENIIKDAEKFICIFTYNIRIDQNYLSRLRNAGKRGVDVRIVFGAENGNPDIINPILDIPGAKVYFKQYLHAKFFYNERELLVGSMNLSEASGKNNFELGVLFKDNEYVEVIKKVKKEAKEIINDATEWSKLSRNGLTNYSRVLTTDLVGHCVRCNEKIKYDPFRPFCSSCYSIWYEWENPYYLEAYCHGCGRARDGISKAFPQCKPCYNKFMSNVERSRIRTPNLTEADSIPSESLDQTLKEIISKHLKRKASDIPIDMDLRSVFRSDNNQRLNKMVNDLEQRFEMRFNTPSKIQDYWDLYSYIAASIRPKTNT